jgi:hypothetical protein
MLFRSRLSIHLLFCILILLTLLAGCSKQEVGWPRWRGPNTDGISAERDRAPEALAASLKILRTAKTRVGYTNVAIQEIAFTQ